MKKEVVFAILSGSVLGLIIAFGVWRANIALKSTISKATAKPQTVQVIKSAQNEFNFTIASPKNLSIATTSTAKITGISKPESQVVVVAQTEDTISKTDAKGGFEVKADLSGGLNILKIVSFDPLNGLSQENLTLVYSSEFAKFLENTEEKSENNKESTNSADAIREKVKEKLAEAIKNPIVYLGIITDITDKTIQIKNEADEILQISLTDEVTEYVKVNDVSKKMELKDLAIGDYIAALGFMGTNVMDGKRILITAKPEEVNFQAIYGEVTEVAKKNLTLKDNKDKDWKVEFAKKWTGPSLKELKQGQKVIIVGLPQETSFSSTRSLFII